MQMVHMFRLLHVAILFLLPSSIHCFAGDPSHGVLLAERWCSSCHVVSSNQQRASGTAPSFKSIARRLPLNGNQLAQSLLVPHPQMPDRGLSSKEAEDIAAYLRSLEN